MSAVHKFHLGNPLGLGTLKQHCLRQFQPRTDVKSHRYTTERAKLAETSITAFSILERAETFSISYSSVSGFNLYFLNADIFRKYSNYPANSEICGENLFFVPGDELLETTTFSPTSISIYGI